MQMLAWACRFYSRELRASGILNGDVDPPKECDFLYVMLNAYTEGYGTDSSSKNVTTKVNCFKPNSGPVSMRVKGDVAVFFQLQFSTWQPKRQESLHSRIQVPCEMKTNVWIWHTTEKSFLQQRQMWLVKKICHVQKMRVQNHETSSLCLCSQMLCLLRIGFD